MTPMTLHHQSAAVRKDQGRSCCTASLPHLLLGCTGGLFLKLYGGPMTPMTLHHQSAAVRKDQGRMIEEIDALRLKPNTGSQGALTIILSAIS